MKTCKTCKHLPDPEPDGTYVFYEDRARIIAAKDAEIARLREALLSIQRIAHQHYLPEARVAAMSDEAGEALANTLPNGNNNMKPQPNKKNVTEREGC